MERQIFQGGERMKVLKIVASVVTFGFVVSMVAICGGQEKAGTQDKAGMMDKASPKATFSYVGLKKCKPCHLKYQYNKWKEDPHAKAYTELASPKSLEVAKKLGLKEEPQKSAQCLSCHVTGYGAAENLKKDVTLEEGVSCEGCHGPGSSYWPMSVMKDLAAGKGDAKVVGLLAQTEESCKKCHNQKSPTYKPFDFKKALPLIAHAYPKEGQK